MSSLDEEYEDDFAEPAAAVSSSTAAVSQQRAATSTTTTTTHSSHSTTAAHRSGKENMDTSNLPSHPPTSSSSHSATHKPTTAATAATASPSAVPAHHYRVSIDIRAIVDLAATPQTVYCRYHYPLFSATSSIPGAVPHHTAVTTPPAASTVITTQPTSVASTAATPLLEAFHLFEFLLGPPQLAQHFHSFPLHIALLSQPKADELAGACLSLQSLLSAPLHHKPDQQLVRVLDGECTLYRGLTASKAAAMNGSNATEDGGVDAVRESWAAKERLQRVGRLRVVMTLEDFGAVEVGSRTHITAAADQPSRPHTAAHSHKLPLSTSMASAAGAESAADRSTAEYQVAWELELWRRNEQARLQSEWQATEAKRLAILEQEYKRQSQLLHTSHSSKQAQLGQLEKKLHHSLHTLQQREQQIANREHELLTRIQQLEQAAERERDEAALTVQRMRDQANHTAAMSKRIVVDMQAQLDVLRGRLKEEEERARRLEEGWRKERAVMGKSSVGEVRLKVSELEMRCRALDEKVEEERREREREEERRMKAEAEVRRLREEVEEKERQWLEEERKSVLKLKMEWAQRARMGGMKRDKEELEEIRRKLRQVQDDGTEPSGAGTAASSSGSERKERERKDEHDSSVNTTIKAPTLPTFYEQWEVRGMAADEASDASMLEALNHGRAPSNKRDKQRETERQEDEHFHHSFPASSGRRTRPSTPPPIQLHHLASSEQVERPSTGQRVTRSHKSTGTRWQDTQEERGRPVVLPAASQQESPVRQHRRTVSRDDERGARVETVEQAAEEERVEEAEAVEEQPTVIIERHTNTPHTTAHPNPVQPPLISPDYPQPITTTRTQPSQPARPSFSSKSNTTATTSSSSPPLLSSADRVRAVERHKRAVVAARKLEAAKDTKEKREEREARERMERRREAWKKESTLARHKKGTATGAGKGGEEKRESGVRVERAAHREQQERVIASESAYVDDDEMIALMNRHEQPASPSTAPAPHASPTRPGRPAGAAMTAALSGTRRDGAFDVPDMGVRGQQFGRVRQAE